MLEDNKKRMGMVNFKEPKQIMNEDDESLPDDVFEEITIQYFNDVFIKYTKELQAVKQELKEIKKLLNKGE